MQCKLPKKVMNPGPNKESDDERQLNKLDDGKGQTNRVDK